MTLVLFVDDDTMALQLMEKASLLLGYQALTSVSPTRALKIAADKQPDVIVVDLNMHEMDGVTLIQALRNQESTCRIPVIVLSATDASQYVAPSSTAGANGYLTKPVDFDELSAAIDRVLSVQKR
jgi:DNA-binding response OmpR family regulator